MDSEPRVDVVPGSGLLELAPTKKAPEPQRDICGTGTSLAATPPEELEAIERFSEWQLSQGEPADLPTEHVIHAGMYVRTIAMPPGMVLTGALIKRPTLVIVSGEGFVRSGGEWIAFRGYRVIPASSGRKQIFISHSTVMISMAFPTSARTVEEAEREFTDDADRLLSRRQNANRAVITEED